MQVGLNTAFPSYSQTQQQQKATVSQSLTDTLKASHERDERANFSFVEPVSMKLKPENMKGNIVDKHV